MKISDSDAAHCATYLFGGTCDHEHIVVFGHCTRPTTFFDMLFE